MENNFDKKYDDLLSQKRLPNESFEDYRARLKLLNKQLKKYLRK